MSNYKIFRCKWGHEKGSYTGFADLFRLKLLLEKGGIWADLDTVCLKPFDFKKKYVFSSENTPDGKIKVNVGVIKVPSNNDFIKSYYEESKKKDYKLLKFGQTGPELIGFKIDEFKLNSFVLPPNAFCPINHWDFKKLVDPRFKFKISRETYAIHLWNEKWRREIKKRSIFGRIQELGNLKESVYEISSKLRRYSKIYQRFICFIKQESLTKWINSPAFKEELTDIKLDKNKIYSEKTLYGKLQRKYL